MLSVSVSEQVKFKSKKCGTVTVLPVTVEFGKFVGSDSHLNSRYKRNTNSSNCTTNRVHRQNTDNLTAPSELLHAVVALYHTYLPGYPLETLYKTVCKEGSRTLLLLRDGSEIINELKKNRKNKSNNTKKTVEINNNKERELGSDAMVSPEEIESNSNVFDVKANEDTNQTISSPSSSSPDEMPNNESMSPTTTTTNDEGIDNASVISGDGYQSDNWSISSQKHQRFRSINDILMESLGTNTRNIWTDRYSNISDNNNNNNSNDYQKTRSRPNSRSSQMKDISKHNSFNTISDIFSDSEDDYDQESMDSEEDEKEDFMRGMEAFLRGVALRKSQLRDLNSTDTSTQLGIEYRLIGCATFHKSYRSPGVKVVCIPFLAVRTRYRRCGIGRFLLKRLKRPSQVGPYDALVIQAEPLSAEFFRKNDFNDDIILNSRFRDSVLDENGRNILPRNHSTGRRDLMCYLPPFDGHYPPMPGTHEWNRTEVMTAIDDEVERWREKSLEAYQCQWTCISRLQQEIIKLRSILKRQENGINKLKKENMNLQKMVLQSETKSTLALIDAWQKETANYG